MMASSSTRLGDIEEKFFECSFCLQTLKEPKTLPCLHRYCRECLRKIISEKKGAFNCPLCDEKCEVPPKGVDAFKTDFFIKSVLEFCQLESRYKEDNVKRCRGCKEVKNAICYCFKCRDFLCQQCYKFHLDNDMLEEHRPHLLDLQTVDVRSLTLKKLISLTEDPRCAVHVKRPAEMCCMTCGNTPICVACVFGDHKGHMTHEVRNLARSEGEKMKAMMTKLYKCKEKLHGLPEKVAEVRRALEENAKEQLQKARIEHKKASEKVLKKAEMEKRVLDKQRKEIIMRNKKECKQVRKEMGKEMEKLKKKYDKILRGKEQSCGREVEKVDTQTGIVDEKSSAKVEKYNRELQGYEEKVRASKVDNEGRISEVVDHAAHTMNRYENLTATARTVQASQDEWTEAQCFPGLTAAGEVLIEDANKELCDLESLSETGVRESVMFIEQVRITDSHESVIDIKGIEEGWQITGITSSGDGHIIVTGTAQGDESHITVINGEGGVVRQDQIQGAEYRYCHSLSQHITATVCQSSQVGLYDNRNGGYVSKNIKDMFSYNWDCTEMFATCVTTDSLNNIYVGFEHKEVLVFDDQLNYLRTIYLPLRARDMAVHENHLIVCDWGGGSYAVTMQGYIVYLFTIPDGAELAASVCTDSSQYIYMLWDTSGGRILTQYSQDGRQLLTTRNLDDDAGRITVIGTEEGEKLLVATEYSRKMYTFGLQEE